MCCVTSINQPNVYRLPDGSFEWDNPAEMNDSELRNAIAWIDAECRRRGINTNSSDNEMKVAA